MTLHSKNCQEETSVYVSGQSERSKALREDLETYLNQRQDKILGKQMDKMTGPDSLRQFFKNVKSYKACDKPKSFDVKDLRPGKPDREVVDEVAGYFNKVSSKFQLLQPHQIPSTYHRDLPLLTTEAVEVFLKK